MLAIALRLFAAWTSPAVVNDSVSLLRSADRVIAEGPAALLDVPHHPLPVALAALFGGLASVELMALVGGAIASGLAVWPLHSLARRACGRHAATAACILYTVLPKAVAVGAVPLAESVFLPLFLGSLALGAGARDAGPRVARRLIGAGVLAGFAYLCRPEGLIAFPGVLAAATLDGRIGRWRRCAVVTLGFVMIATPYVVLLSAHQGRFTLSPKKDIVRFVGAAAPQVGVPSTPPPVAAHPGGGDTRLADTEGTWTVARGVASALESALTVPVTALVALGLLGFQRWRRRRSRRPRLLLAGTALLLLVLVARLQAGWGYAGGRHALAAGVLLLPFAGQGLATLGGMLARVTSRRRFAIFAAVLLSLPLAARAALRPPGEGGYGARRLGERVAEAVLARGGGPDAGVRIASSAEPLVAYYADRDLRAAGSSARDVPLWGRFVHPIEEGADFARVVDALAEELRREADWVVFDVATEPDAIARRLAEALRERGALGAPAVAAGGELAAFPIQR